jgi:hypothetical protein
MPLANTLHMNRVLTPTEDADLRRLNALVRYASTAPLLAARFEQLRSRDRRISVRDVPTSDLIQVAWDSDDE